MLSTDVIAVLHLISTLAMTGIILFVQVVHYPLMARVGLDGYVEYQAGHTVRTSWVVIPLMLTELGSAVWLAAFPPGLAEAPAAWLGLGLLAVIWVSTALFQVRAHQRLADGFDDVTHRRLVRTNWVRTVAWLGRVPVALVLAF